VSLEVGLRLRARESTDGEKSSTELNQSSEIATTPAANRALRNRCTSTTSFWLVLPQRGACGCGRARRGRGSAHGTRRRLCPRTRGGTRPVSRRHPCRCPRCSRPSPRAARRRTRDPACPPRVSPAAAPSVHQSASTGNRPGREKRARTSGSGWGTSSTPRSRPARKSDSPACSVNTCTRFMRR